MKTRLNLFTLFVIGGLLIVSGCQKEVTEIIEPPVDEVFSPESPVANLIERTSLRDGSSDNIIDKSSCTSIELPITVVVNGLEIILDSEEDFYTVEHIIDRFDDDDDVIDILFPINIILADHTDVKISNDDEFEKLLDQCTESEEDDDIECVDFKFPISISLYNSASLVSDVLTINSDKELYKLIHNLDDDDIASINFPIKVMLADGTELEIRNQKELEEALKNAINECDEDDDNDHNDDDVDDSKLVQVLLEGYWEIDDFVDEKDIARDFKGYLFKFYESGLAKVKKGDVIIEGKWYSHGNAGRLELELGFPENSIFGDLSKDWYVIEFDGDIIKLNHGLNAISVDNNVITSYLTFKRPSDIPDISDQMKITDVIVEGQWIVANYNDSGENNTSDFNDYKLNFTPDGKVTATKGNNVITGEWSETVSDGVKQLVLNFGDKVPFDELNDEWDIVDVQEKRIEVKDISGGDGTIDKLVLERL